MNSLDTQAFLFRAVTTDALIENMTTRGLLEPSQYGENYPHSMSAMAHFSTESRVQARHMGEVYELLYCLENSVRELIESTLREVHGAEWWNKLPQKLREQAEKRKLDDESSRWHSPRGESLLNYLDFPQYAQIISEQWVHFESLIGDQPWMTNYFAEINRSRRALAHTGKLKESDVARMAMRVDDWLRVVG
jgi:hypothetical protein